MRHFTIKGPQLVEGQKSFSFMSLQGEAEAIIREKGSRFIGYSRPVRSDQDVENFLSEIKSSHPKARHHCYAWRMGYPDITERANDDGEPSGTAGRPILGQLIRREQTNAMVIVVRYFGGTLLGTSGLIQAYKECADAVLKAARQVRIVQKEYWGVEIDFSIVHILEEWAPQLAFHILSRDHVANRMKYKMEIEKALSESARIALIARLASIYPEEVDPETEEYEQFSLYAEISN